MKQDKKLMIAMICESLFLAILYLCFVYQYKGFFLSEDELGYWGSAAKIAGLDWGNVLEGMNYYSYGYSLVLAIFLKLPIRPVFIYRIAVGFNAIYILVSFYIAFYIFTNIFKEKSKYLISIACMVGMCYVSYVTQSAISWPELFLVMILWLITLQVYLLCEKITVKRLAIFIIEIIYIYMIHMRMLSVVFAGVLFLFFLGLRNKQMRKWVLITLGGAVVLFLASNLIKTIIQHQVYNVEATANMGNDYSTILKGDFSFTTVWGFILSALGQMYGLVLSSYGILIVGIVACVLYGIKKWKEKSSHCFLFAFIMVTFWGAWFISSFFLKGVSVGRFDSYFYSRYMDNVISFLVILGLIELLTCVSKKEWIIYGVSALLLIAVLAVSVSYRARTYGLPMSYYQGVCAPGTYMWYKFFGVSMFRMTGVLLAFIVLLAALIWSGYLNKKTAFLKWGVYVIVSILWIYGGRLVVQDQVIPYENENNRDLVLKNDVCKWISEQNANVAFVSTNPHSIRGSVQLYLKDKPIQYLRTWEEVMEACPDILIVDDEEVMPYNGEIVYELFANFGAKMVWRRVGKDDWTDSIGTFLEYSYIDVSKEAAGYSVFGPYIKLPAGDYRVVYEINIDKAMSQNPDISQGITDVYADESVFGREVCQGIQDEYIVNIHLDSPTNRMEFRFYKESGSEASIRNIHVMTAY